MLLSEQSNAITGGEKRRERDRYREMGEKMTVGRKVGPCNFKDSHNTVKCFIVESAMTSGATAIGDDIIP